MKRAIYFLGLLITFAMSALAQDPAPKTINGGVLNGKAVSLPKPAYPAEAKEANAGGAVAVDIVIDESGTVVSAVSQPYDQSVKKKDDGTPGETKELHPALRQSAETAALGAKFSPTLLSGEPVRVTGRIVYNFVAGGSSPDMNKANGGVLNGRARSLPTPAYPPAAMAVRASGAVSVQVTVDEEGNVISAAAVSGHPLLRAAAVSAAREAKFVPVLLEGKPVKVNGVVVYNFTPGDDSVRPNNQ